jgi:hypothetical protein
VHEKLFYYYLPVGQYGRRNQSSFDATHTQTTKDCLFVISESYMVGPY